MAQKWFQIGLTRIPNGPKMGQDGSKMAQEAPKILPRRAQGDPWSPRWRATAQNKATGPLLAHSSPTFGLSWPYVGSSLAHFGSIWESWRLSGHVGFILASSWSHLWHLSVPPLGCSLDVLYWKCPFAWFTAFRHRRERCWVHFGFILASCGR